MTTKSRTVGDILDELEALERKRAVYADIVVFLSQFISSDTHTPQKGMKSPIGGEEVISEEIIDLVRAEQEDQVREIEKEISKLRGRQTQGTHSAKPKHGRKAPKKRRRDDKGKQQGKEANRS